MGAVGEHPFFYLRQQVHILWGIGCHPGEQRLGEFAYAQQLQQGDTAGAGGRRSQHLQAPPVVLQWCAPDRPIASQVLQADDAAAGPHLRRYLAGDLAAIETVGIAGDKLQAVGQLRLDEGLAVLQAAEIIDEVGLACGLCNFPGRHLRQLRRHHKAFAGQLHRRLQQLRPGQGAVALVCRLQAAHGSRHPCGQAPDQRALLHEIALPIEVHIAVGRQRGALAKVQEGGLALHIAEHEAAAADIARLRVGDRQHKGSRYCRVYGVAAGEHDLLRRRGAVAVRHRHRRRCRLYLRDQPQGQQQQQGTGTGRGVKRVAAGHVSLLGKGRRAIIYTATRRVCPYACMIEGW